VTGNQILQAIPEEGSAADAQRPDLFVARNGIVFKLKPVAPLLILDAQRGIIEPAVPKVRNLEKGDSDDAPWEENPNDPTYIAALTEYRMKVGEVSNAIFLTRGTAVEYIPDGIDKVDDADWAEEVEEFTDLTIPKVGRRRYYCWVKYVALTSMEDFQGLLNKLTTLGGVTQEADVRDAETTFRPDESGSSTEGLPPTEEV
jgi:hypothetical protein